jgi:flagellar hook-associated protein 3 FlgL
VTGLKEDITLASGGKVGDAHLIRQALDQLEQTKQINSIVGDRISLAGQALSSVRETLNDINVRGTIALATETSVGIDSIATEARTAVTTVLATLSTRQGSRYLFSGESIDTPPFFKAADQLISDISGIVSTAGSPADIETALDFYFDDPAGGFNTTIYQGSETSSDAFILTNGERVDFGITGNDPSIKNMLKGLATLAVARENEVSTTDTNFQSVFNTALNTVGSGIAGMTAIETQLGIHAMTVDRANAQNTAEEITLNQTYQSIVGVDQYVAAGELQSLQVQLESSYIITARMADLNLVNFLR